MIANLLGKNQKPDHAGRKVRLLRGYDRYAFECNYCKDPFCSEHRLPEEHRCVKLTQLRAKRFGEKSKIIRDGGTGKKNRFRKMLGRFGK